jgi:hypothetical protein
MNDTFVDETDTELGATLAITMTTSALSKSYKSRLVGLRSPTGTAVAANCHS